MTAIIRACGPLAPDIGFFGLKLRLGQEIAVQKGIGGVMTVGIFQETRQTLTQKFEHDISLQHGLRAK